jgi:redox-sensitive bicupin YhaK (pirin superfamily)
MRVLRAADRFVTRTEGIVTAHCFSFGAHFDPANTGFGALVAHNDEQLAPGHGYDPHPHAATEIVSWVVSGSLVHTDTAGNRHTLPAGSVQRLSAGRGVRHEERNASTTQPLRFVQAWLRPDDPELEPTYGCDQPVLAAAGWTDVVGGDAHLGVGTSGATLRVARVRAGAELTVPAAASTHLYVVSGDAELDGVGLLHAGDSARMGAESPALVARGDVELMAWSLPPQSSA